MNYENLRLFYDTETSDMVDWKKPSGGEQQPHLVQLAAYLVNVEQRRILQSMDVIIKPEGWEFAEEAYKTHGISPSYAAMVGIPEKAALSMFLNLWSIGGQRIATVAHNRTFDQRIIRIGTKRYFGEGIQDAWYTKGDSTGHECTMLLAKPIMKLPPKSRYGYKKPSLVEAYKFFTGKQLVNAHSASADALACMEVWYGIHDGITESQYVGANDSQSDLDLASAS